MRTRLQVGQMQSEHYFLSHTPPTLPLPGILSCSHHLLTVRYCHQRHRPWRYSAAEMDLQPENDSDLNVAKDCRRQQRKGKGMRSSALQTEQQMSSGEMEFQNASEDLQGNDESHRKGGTLNSHTV